MGTTILITGANRGIGLELARVAASRNMSVIATARMPGAAEALNALTAHGDVSVMGLDVTDNVGLEAASAAVARPVDILVCNAGQYLARGGIDDPDHSAEAWRDVMMSNVAGVFFTVRAFLPHLRKAARPRIAVISSTMGSTARAPGGSYIYRASKAAATNLARNLAADLAGEGISVGAYHPGWVRTDMGGGSADISVQESAAGLMERFDQLGPDNSGVFEDYSGQPIPF